MGDARTLDEFYESYNFEASDGNLLISRGAAVDSRFADLVFATSSGLQVQPGILPALFQRIINGFPDFAKLYDVDLCRATGSELQLGLSPGDFLFLPASEFPLTINAFRWNCGLPTGLFAKTRYVASGCIKSTYEIRDAFGPALWGACPVWFHGDPLVVKVNNGSLLSCWSAETGKLCATSGLVYYLDPISLDRCLIDLVLI